MNLRVVSWLLLGLVAASCGGSGSDCSEIGCENDASVSFVGDPIVGAFDLVVDTDGGTFMSRCADPGAPESPNNDPEVRCSANGFVLEGAAAVGHSVFVTILPEGQDPLVENTEVLLSVVDESHPNGEDCPPTCYSRNGQLIF